MRTILLAAAIALLIAGCVPSLHPLYREGETVFEPKLLGEWSSKNDDDRDRWKFARGEQNAYRVEYTPEGETNAFEARLVEIGERRYLDFYPEKPDDAFERLTGFFRLHVLPVHTFARVELADDKATLAFLHPEWLDKLLKENPEALQHERVARAPAGEIVITAETGELQTFVRNHADDEKAWRVKLDLKRESDPE